MSSRTKSALALIFMILTIAVSLSAQQAPAQDAIPTQLTLELATEIALARNPTILAERQNIVMARADLAQARLRPNPDLSIGADSYQLGAPSGPFYQNGEFSVVVGQPIEIAGKRGKRIQVAEQEGMVASSTLQDTVRRLRLELKTRYYRVVLAKAELRLANEVLSQFDEIIAINQARYDRGELSGLDLARVQTERTRFFNDLVSADLVLQNAKTALLELLGSNDLAASFDVSETLDFRPLEISAMDLQEQALVARPDLQASRQQIERERGQVAVERSLGLPNVTPFAGYNQNFGLNTVILGVRWDLPLFHRNQGGIAHAVARLDQAGYEERRVELAVQSQVQQAYQAVQAQEKLVRAYQTSYVDTAQRARDITQASYRLGALELTVFLDAERAYRETLRGYYGSMFAHQASIFQLEAAVGREF